MKAICFSFLLLIFGITLQAQERLFATGLAAFQANEMQGITASRAPYDPQGMTTAHRFLPYGTQLKVVNKTTKKEIIVTVNDRGPFGSADRILDLSWLAGETLGGMRGGTTLVDVYVLSPIPDYFYRLPTFFEVWTLQVASTANLAWAKDHVKKLGAGAYFDEKWISGQRWYRIFYGEFINREAAQGYATHLAGQGFPNAFPKYLLEEHPEFIDFSAFGGPRATRYAN